MTPKEFERLVAEGYTRIPLHCEVVADLENPLSTFVKLADQPYSFLFESVVGGEKWGCLLYTSPSPRDATLSRMPSSA